MIKVLFSYKHAIGSWIIKTGMRTPYSHVALEIDSVVYEAVGHGIHKVTRKEFLKKNILVKEILVNEFNKLEILQRSEESLGGTYDYPALLWFTLVIICSPLFRLPRLSINPKWMVCSEFVWYALTGKKITLDPDEVELLLSQGDF